MKHLYSRLLAGSRGNQTILALCLILSFCHDLSPQASKSTGVELKVVEACRVELTPVGRQASFQMTGIYNATVDDKGFVMILAPVKNVDHLKAFVQMEQFESCVKRWQFANSGDYILSLQAGTTGETLAAWAIVAVKGNSSVRLVLPRLE